MKNIAGMLPNSTYLGPVHLRVTDIPSAIPVWTDIVGLTVTGNGDGWVHLGTSRCTLVVLDQSASEPAAGKSVGLFHLAIHLPSRLELARVAGRLRATGYAYSAQDHLVSESIYLTDPDGNGIELCFSTPHRARIELLEGTPRFITPDGAFHSGLDPLDIEDLLSEMDGPGDGSGSLPADTYVGHIHLRSNEPEVAMAFYTEVLGFKPHVASAAFGMFDCGTEVAPHMVAFNTWGGRNLPKAANTAAGLMAFTVELSPAALRKLEERLAAKGVVTVLDGPVLLCSDPDGHRIRLVPAELATT